MAVSDHLKVASAELRKAAELVKQEIENLRSEETKLNRTVNDKIAELSRRIRHYEHELQTNSDPQQTPQIQAMLNHTTQEIAQKNAEIRNQQKQIEDSIRGKQRVIEDLESKSRVIQP